MSDKRLPSQVLEFFPLLDRDRYPGRGTAAEPLLTLYRGFQLGLGRLVERFPIEVRSVLRVQPSCQNRGVLQDVFESNQNQMLPELRDVAVEGDVSAQGACLGDPNRVCQQRCDSVDWPANQHSARNRVFYGECDLDSTVEMARDVCFRVVPLECVKGE